jgi:hypothetical protein
MENIFIVLIFTSNRISDIVTPEGEIVMFSVGVVVGMIMMK